MLDLRALGAGTGVQESTREGEAYEGRALAKRGLR